MTGFEIHLVDRHSVAQKQFITVAGSAVFGTFVSMLLASIASSYSKTISEPTVEVDTAAREEGHPRMLPPASQQGEGSGQPPAIHEPPETMAFAAPTQAPTRQALWVGLLIIGAALAIHFRPSGGYRAGLRAKIAVGQTSGRGATRA